jgi:hypothetical protein
MAKRSRYLEEAESGKLVAGEIQPATDAPYLPPEPIRTRAGDIVHEVIEQPPFYGCGSQAALLATIRAAMNAKSREPTRRAVGVRHSRSLRRVS